MTRTSLKRHLAVAFASGRTTPVSLLRQPYCSLALRDLARTALSASAGETSTLQIALEMVSVTTSASTTKRRCTVTEEDAVMWEIRFISKWNPSWTDLRPPVDRPCDSQHEPAGRKSSMRLDGS